MITNSYIPVSVLLGNCKAIQMLLIEVSETKVNASVTFHDGYTESVDFDIKEVDRSFYESNRDLEFVLNNIQALRKVYALRALYACPEVSMRVNQYYFNNEANELA